MGKLILGLVFIALIAALVLLGANYWEKNIKEHKFEVKLAKENKDVPLGLTEKYIKSVSVVDINTNQPKVVIEFDEKGKKILDKIAAQNKDLKITIETEGKKLTEYSIRIENEKIILTGFVNADQAKDVAEMIKK